MSENIEVNYQAKLEFLTGWKEGGGGKATKN